MSALTCLLCGLFLDGGISAHRAIDPPSSVVISGVEYQRAWANDINRTRNPYGIVALGYEFDLGRRLRLQFKVQHESSLATDDHGTDSAQLVLRWKPFGRTP